jgi:hypothetical protein
MNIQYGYNWNWEKAKYAYEDVLLNYDVIYDVISSYHL